MIWRFAPIIGLVALLCPVVAKAQTNLDQGKSASQIFANACVECHKEPRGLARGRSASALTDFLREHYTTNGQQAAALAAYVLGGRSADTAPTAPVTQGRGKPVPERALAEEPKPNRQGRVQEGPKSARLEIPLAKWQGLPSRQARTSNRPSCGLLSGRLQPRTTGARNKESPRQRRANPMQAGCKRRLRRLRSQPAQASRQIANRAGSRVRLPLRLCRRKPHPYKPRRPRPARIQPFRAIISPTEAGRSETRRVTSLRPVWRSRRRRSHSG